MKEITEQENDAKPVTDEDIKNFQKDLDVALTKSDDLVKNFEIYVGLYKSTHKAQTTHLSKEEYEMLQDSIKCYKVKSLNEFLDNFITEDNDYVSKQAFKITRDNFAMAFYPVIWKVLKFEERIAAMRVAWEAVHGKEIKEFCNNVTTTIVFVGNDYKGSLNVFSIGVIEPYIILKSIFNAENMLKFNYYFNKRETKKYNSIKDFESFEEMEYNSPLEPVEQNINKLNNYLKAIYYSQIERKKTRKNYLNADYTLLDHCEKLLGLCPDFDNEFQKEIEEFNAIDNLVMKELGLFQKDIDENYLSKKVDLFNQPILKEHNELCDKYNQLDDKIKKIKEPVLKQTEKLRERKKELQKELDNAQDMIEITMCRNEIDNLVKKMNKIYDKCLNKKEQKELHDLEDERTDIYNKIQVLDSQLISFEEAKEHFKDHFYNKKPQKYVAINTSNLSLEDYKKLN